MFVYVLNKDGKPLMPCSPAKAKKLLKTNKAKVKHITPFTIQLLYGSSGYKQEITLGLDTGSKYVGFSATTDKTELLSGELLLRDDVSAKIQVRKTERRSRRTRKLRHRKPRYNNRIRRFNKNLLPPSYEVKIQEHITMVNKIIGILPITKIVVETADIDKKNFWNTLKNNSYNNKRLRILERDNFTCQICGKSLDSNPNIRLEIHHIESRITGGNAFNNLITLCSDCHTKVHNKEVKLDAYRGKSRRDISFMRVMKSNIIVRLRKEIDVEIEETNGFITKSQRELISIPKSHINDAYCISGNIYAKRCDLSFIVKAVRHHNRQIHKMKIIKGGKRKLNKSEKYVFGYSLFDKVLFNGEKYFVWSRRKEGGFKLKGVNTDKTIEWASYKKLRLLERGSNYIIKEVRVLD